VTTIKFYCEYKRKEIELSKTTKAPISNKFFYECSDNYKIIDGKKIEVGCRLQFSPECQQLKHRIM
jgi:hypothetical protein